MTDAGGDAIWLHRLQHWLAHLTGWNECRAISWHDSEGNHFSGAECVTCGKVHPGTVVDWRKVNR